MDPQGLCCVALTTRCKPWRSLCVQFFAPPSTPLVWLALGFGLLALRTHGGWTTEFGAHRAAFTVHAPARHGSSCAFCSAGPWGAGYRLRSGLCSGFSLICAVTRGTLGIRLLVLFLLTLQLAHQLNLCGGLDFVPMFLTLSSREKGGSGAWAK